MLINCPECELMVSDKAFSCPHCGYPMKGQKRRESAKRKRNLEWLRNEISKIPSGEIFGFEK